MPDYEELKEAVQKMLTGGQLTPDIKAVLVRHGIFEIPQLDHGIDARCINALSKLKEPMRDTEFGIFARRELEMTATTLLDILPLVRAVVVWRAGLPNEAPRPYESDLSAVVDKFLAST